jgi:hypothetical protein
MIWIGGKTYELKEKKRIDRLTNWHKWFAWHPVTVEIVNGRKRKAWLCKVYRKLTRVGGLESYWWNREYSTSLPYIMKDFLTNEKGR